MSDESEEDLTKEMGAFFRRSVAANRAKGSIPSGFDVSVEDTLLSGSKSKGDDSRRSDYFPQEQTLAPGPPTIDDCFPNNGRKSGGSRIGIVGGGYIENKTHVFFNNIEATTVHFINGGAVECTAPATPESPFAVPATIKIVVDPTGQHVEKSGLFTYFGPPEITSVVPNHASGAGGNVVDLIGQFAFGSVGSTAYRATFGGILINATRLSSTDLQVVVPAHTVGPVDVVVIAPDHDHQTATLAGGFTYDLPAGSIPDHRFALNNPPVYYPALNIRHGVLSGPFAIFAFDQATGLFDPAYNGILDTFFAAFYDNMAFIAYTQNVQFVNGVGFFQIEGQRGPLTGFGHNGYFGLYAHVPIPNGYSNFLAFGQVIDPFYG